ncbi:MAG: exopolyphosphatase [Bacteroidetes bacterium]|nr:exopolyphosphatase [Bacteroidota bacterium]
MKFAAIDIGSNALRLLITEVIENGSGVKYKQRVFIRVPVRLGEDVFLQQKISTEKTEKLIKALASFKSLIELFEVKTYMACATSAFREAENGKKIIDKIKDEVKLKAEIIDGKREAEMIYSCHVAEKLNHNKSYLYVDVGGGSTELTLFSKEKLIFSNSFPVGTVRLLYDKVSINEWEKMKEAVKEISKDISPLIAIGTGGNINKLYKLLDPGDKYIGYKKMKELYEELSDMSIEQRIKKFGFNEDRADVIVPAAKIYLSVMKWADINDIYVPKLGLADGIINLLYEKQQSS